MSSQENELKESDEQLAALKSEEQGLHEEVITASSRYVKNMLYQQVSQNNLIAIMFEDS